MTNGNWALKQCEHCSWRSKCFERGCFQTCHGFTHEMPTLHTFFGLKAWAFWPWAIMLMVPTAPCVLLAYFSLDSRPTTHHGHHANDGQHGHHGQIEHPKLVASGTWPLRHCAKNHLQRIFRAKLQDKEATHLPRYFQVFWCTFGHMKKTSRVRSNVVRFSMDNLQEPLVWIMQKR